MKSIAQDIICGILAAIAGWVYILVMYAWQVALGGE